MRAHPLLNTLSSLACAATLLAGVACRAGSASVPVKRPRPFTRAESLAYLDPRTECGLLARAANPDPVRLVQEYVRRDNDGEFLRSNGWVDTAYLCPGHLPAPDAFTVVRRSRVASASVNGTLARIVVTSDGVGTVRYDSLAPVFELGARSTVDTFTVTNTPFGWRIKEPQLPMNVLGSSVLAHPERIPLRESSRIALARALAPARVEH